jgi:NitT/TauT family transport system permease protein
MPNDQPGEKRGGRVEGALGARLRRLALPYVGLAALVLTWDLAIRLSSQTLLPGPAKVLGAIVELTASGEMVRHVVASLFRVTWGFLAAAVTAIPLGLMLGWYPRGERAGGPLLQLLRPISPLAWIPLAILWFGVGDLSSVFVIFLAVFCPLTLSSIEAARNIPSKFVHAGRNFGLSTRELLFRIVFPAALPQLLLGLRLSLGIAWLVVVAAEMIAVDSGLGFLIVDARNAGNRYDLVVAGMVVIGVIGVGLDVVMRRLQASRALAWNFHRIGDAPTEGPIERRRVRRSTT